MSSISFLRASYSGVETNSFSKFTLLIIPGGRIEKKMKDTLTDRMRGLAEIRNRSSSNEEFWLKATVEGTLPGFWTTTLFRLCLLWNEHPSLKWLEIGILGLGVVGFSLWGGLVGPDNPLDAFEILLLAIAVLAPLELLFLSLEDLRRMTFGRRR